MECLPRADARSAAVAAASVVAKVVRDDAMRALSEPTPATGSNAIAATGRRNTGNALVELGPVPGPPPKLRRGGRLKDKSSGAWGEDLALRYLTRRGYTLVERNYRTRRGEIDLIVRNEDILVFVEVKLRRTTGFGDPLEAVTPASKQPSAPLAEQYLYTDNQPDFDTLRFDVVGILADRTRGTRIEHIEDAF